MAPQTQVNSATLIMGVTGAGKSSLLATLARYVYAKWGKVSLYYNCDGGGYPAEIQALVNAGIIWVFRMRTRDPGDMNLAFETCYRSAQGWWPRRINPATGEVEPGCEMVPPVVKRFEMYCPSGHLLKSVPAQSMLGGSTKCPHCQVVTTPQNMQVRELLKPSAGFEKVGAVMYDGLSSMLSWEMQELGQRAGKLELKGEEAAIGGKVVSGSLKFGGTTRSHVGFAQSRGEELVHLTLGIPNLVVPPIFTALSMEASDEANLSIVGPKIAGRAKTDEAPQWFGNCLEAAKIPNPAGTGEQRVLYLEEFTDTEGRRHLCKHRGSPKTMPATLADPPNDVAPFSQFNLGVFYEQLDIALQARIGDVRAEFPDAPGLPGGIMEFGDGNKVEAPAAVPAPGQPAAPAAAAKPAAATAPKSPAAPAQRGKAAPKPAQPATTQAAAAPEAATAASPAVAAAAPTQAPLPIPAKAASTPAAPAGRPASGAAPPPGSRPASVPAGPAMKPPAAAPRVAAGSAPAARTAAAPAKPPQ